MVHCTACFVLSLGTADATYCEIVPVVIAGAPQVAVVVT